MALTTDPFDATELAAYISETWTPLTLVKYFAKAIAANHFRDLSEFAQDGSDIFHVPGVFTNAFSVQTQSTQGTEVTTDAPASDDVTVTVSTHKYIATLLGALQQVQVARHYNISEIYAQKAGGTLMIDLEDVLLALWSGLSTNSVGDTATVLSDAEIRCSVEKLATLDIPLDECAWILHTFVYWVQILAVQKFYDQSQRGGTMALVPTGNFGPADANRGYHGALYGIPCYTSSRVVNGLQTFRNLLAHKDAFGFAHQTPGANRVRVQSAPWLANIALLTVFDTIYGVAELRDDLGVVVNANNAFIGS